MTAVETLAIGFVMSIFSGLIGVLIGGRRKVSVDDFEKHRESSNPHIACPVHETKLNIMDKKLDSIEDKLNELLNR